MLLAWALCSVIERLALAVFLHYTLEHTLVGSLVLVL